MGDGEIAAGPRQHSYFLFRVPRDFTSQLSDLAYLRNIWVQFVPHRKHIMSPLQKQPVKAV
jgi:hypothetical protein